MKSFEVPVNLEDIGAMSFVACPSLETITVADGNAKYTAVDNVLYDSEESILYLYPAGRSDTSFTLPDSTLVVYAGAFFAAGNLQQITFDEKLQYIGEMAFDFCSGLTSLNIPKGVTTIGTTAFADCTGLTSVTFDGASDEDGGDGDKLEIGDYAFFSTDNLIGYTGAASDYVKDCDVDISFKSVNFNWKGLIFWAVLVVVLAAVVLIAVRIIRRTMMTAEEKLALKSAQAEQKVPLMQREESSETEEPEFDDGYRSILADDEDDAEEVADYEQTISHSQLHSIGHADAAEPEEKAPEEENKSENE